MLRVVIYRDVLRRSVRKVGWLSSINNEPSCMQYSTGKPEVKKSESSVINLGHQKNESLVEKIKETVPDISSTTGIHEEQKQRTAIVYQPARNPMQQGTNGTYVMTLTF